MTQIHEETSSLACGDVCRRIEGYLAGVLNDVTVLKCGESRIGIHVVERDRLLASPRYAFRLRAMGSKTRIRLVRKLSYRYSWFFQLVFSVSFLMLALPLTAPLTDPESVKALLESQKQLEGVGIYYAIVLAITVVVWVIRAWYLRSESYRDREFVHIIRRALQPEGP